MKRAIARRPVAAFLLIAIGALLVTATIPPLTATDSRHSARRFSV
ncbi:MAG: hypothetical protein ACRDNX_04190 [Gaiellaceae bacterium]